MGVTPLGRRQFARRLAGPLVAALPGVAGTRSARAGPRGAGRGLDDPGLRDEAPPLARGVFPTGELAARIRLTSDRLAEGPPPLEDLEGCGLYLGAVAVLPPRNTNVTRLLRGVLPLQQSDGRFGPPDLDLGAAGEPAARAALFRSCGRLLVGLVEQWETGGEAGVLSAAQRLGRFLVAAVEASSRPAALEPLYARDGAASLTQLAEGFVLLAEATQERRLRDAARALIPLLKPPPRTGMTDHLATLRGLLRLARAEEDRSLLRDVAARYHALGTAPGLSPAGGLQEGAADDEAASVAEFLRLSLALWPATADPVVLEQAERCLVNRFRFLQGGSGDFAPRPTDPLGYAALPVAPAGPLGASTSRAHRAFRDVLDSLVRVDGDTVSVDLFDDVEVTLPGLSFALRCRGDGPGSKDVLLEILDAKADLQGLAIRRPAWAVETLRFDGRRFSPAAGPYARIVRRWRGGEQLELLLETGPRLQGRHGRPFALSGSREAAEGLLFIGPRLMAAHEGAGARFLAEPAAGSPAFRVPGVLERGRPPASPFVVPGEDVSLDFRGRPEESASPLTLLPLAAATGLPAGRAAIWLRYLSEG